MTESLGLLFVEPRDAEDFIPQAHVHLRGRSFTLDGKMLLTRATTGWSEFEQELDRLQHELDAIRQEAALKFARCAAQRYGDISVTAISKDEVGLTDCSPS